MEVDRGFHFIQFHSAKSPLCLEFSSVWALLAARYNATNVTLGTVRHQHVLARCLHLNSRISLFSILAVAIHLCADLGGCAKAPDITGSWLKRWLMCVLFDDAIRSIAMWRLNCADASISETIRRTYVRTHPFECDCLVCDLVVSWLLLVLRLVSFSHSI
jgi:hypothetical protein